MLLNTLHSEHFHCADVTQSELMETVTVSLGTQLEGEIASMFYAAEGMCTCH